MARYNEILVGRYNRLLQKLLSMKGPASLISISDEAIATIPLFHGVENRYLEGWDRFALSAGPVGGAAQKAGVRIRNPFGSNIILVFESMMLVGLGAAADQPIVQQAALNTNLTSVVNPTATDPRGRLNSATVSSTDVNAALIGGTFYQVAVLPNTTKELINTINQEIVLLPNQSLQITSNVAAQQLQVNLFWRERFLEDSERA